MNTQKAWAAHKNTIDHLPHNPAKRMPAPHDSDSGSALESQPWTSPRTVIQQNERGSYDKLKDRLARVPSRSKQKRQSLYIDLWTGQHWLGLTLSYPEGYEILKPISVDTALSLATIGSYRQLNQPLFEDRYTGNLGKTG